MVECGCVVYMEAVTPPATPSTFPSQHGNFIFLRFYWHQLCDTAVVDGLDCSECLFIYFLTVWCNLLSAFGSCVCCMASLVFVCVILYNLLYFRNGQSFMYSCYISVSLLFVPYNACCVLQYLIVCLWWRVVAPCGVVYYSGGDLVCLMCAQIY